jgi:hypothetical protein
VPHHGNPADEDPAGRYLDEALATLAPHVRVFTEDGRVVALIEDSPFVSEGVDVDDALADLCLALREYADDWDDRLSDAPNHVPSRALVRLARRSTDAELRTLFARGGKGFNDLNGGAQPPPAAGARPEVPQVSRGAPA